MLTDDSFYRKQVREAPCNYSLEVKDYITLGIKIKLCKRKQNVTREFLPFATNLAKNQFYNDGIKNIYRLS